MTYKIDVQNASKKNSSQSCHKSALIIMCRMHSAQTYVNWYIIEMLIFSNIHSLWKYQMVLSYKTILYLSTKKLYHKEKNVTIIEIEHK